MKSKSQIFKVLAGVICFILSTSSQAWYVTDFGVAIGAGPGPGGYGYYNRGGYYYGGPPNVIINVPVQRYRQPYCEDVEVCDPYDRCWIEQYCN